MVLVAVQLFVLGLYLPPVFKNSCHHIHPKRSFRCRSRLPCDRYRALGALVVLVAVQLFVPGLYFPPVFDSCCQCTAPDDHFAAGPHCCVISSGSGRVGRAGSCPTIRAGIVSPAGVRVDAPSSTPDDHFTAGPDCCVAIGQWARWWCWSPSNYPCWDCIFRQCSK